MMNKYLAILIVVMLPLTSMAALTVDDAAGATNITATSAWICVSVTSTGSANPYLFAYWGTNDGVTSTVGTWKNTNIFGVCTQATYSFQATNLTAFTVYYYRARATNMVETNSWASYTWQFRTLTSPTTAPPSSVQAVTVDTNDVLKHPTNFFVVNSNKVISALSGTYASGTDMTMISNRVVILEGQTNLIHTATNLIEGVSNRVVILEGQTNLVHTATNLIEGISNRVVILEGQTNAAILAGVTAKSATNLIEAISNRVVTLEQNTNTLNIATNALQIQIATLNDATNTLNTATNRIQAQIGTLNDATNKLNTATNALQIQVAALVATNLSQYQPWQFVFGTNDAAATCTYRIKYTDGPLIAFIVTNSPSAFQVDESTYAATATNGVMRIGLELWQAVGTDEISFAVSQFTNSPALTFTSGWNSVFFRRTGTNKIWSGRQ